MQSDRSETDGIITALADYAIALDTQAPDRLRKCFTPSARLDLDGIGLISLDDYIMLCRKVLPRLVGTHHQIGLPSITVSRLRARSRAYFTAVHISAASPDVRRYTVGGWYDDEWINDGNGWRIRHRRGTSIWTEGSAAILLEGAGVGAIVPVAP